MHTEKIRNRLVALCYSIYPKKISALLLKSDSELHIFLKKNRLDHYFALKYDKESKLIAEYKNYKLKIANSLRILRKKLKNNRFIVIKTLSSYPHVTSDLDIVVEKADTAVKFKNIPLPIAYDISHQISWTGDEEISHNFIWSNTENSEFAGIKILVPNQKLDILIRSAHLPFEQAEIRLGELLHIFNQMKNINWSIVSEEAILNSWPKTFIRTKNFFAEIHHKLFFEKNYLFKRIK